MSNPETKAIAYDLKEREAMQKEADTLLGSIAVKLISNEEMFNNMFPAMQGVMSAWAGKNPFKKIAAKTALWSMPHTVNSLGKNAGDDHVAKDMARMLQLKWLIKADKNRENPTANVETVITAIREFISNSDLGAFKEMLDTTKEGIAETTEQFNALMLDYIGKTAVFAAILPTVLDIGTSNVKSLLNTQLEMLPPVPDLIYEVMEGVWEAIDGKKIGEMLNLHFEIQKRLSTGNHLAGDGVRPALQLLTAKVLREVVPEIDPKSFTGMKVGNEENKEAIKNGVSDFLKETPEFGKAFFTHKTEIANAKIRGKRNRLQALLDMENFDEIVADSAEKFDSLELADIITAVLELINVAHESNPELIPTILNQIFASIDPGEMEAAGDGIIRDAIKAVKPSVAPLLPGLINGFCDLMTPEPGEEDSEMTDALTRLKSVLGGA